MTLAGIPARPRPASRCLRALSAAAACVACAAQAVPVTITTPYMNLDNRAVNSLGFNPGLFLRVGANSVVPNGVLGTTGVATSTNPVNGATLTRAIPFSPGPEIPNFFQLLMADSAANRGAWTLAFSNGADTTRTTVSLPAGTTQAPFVNTITLSGTSANPTFTWAPPPGAVVNGYRINLYDKALVNNDPARGPTSNGQVASTNLAPNITAHTVTAAEFTTPGYAFQLNHNYSIEISLIQTKDGGSTNLGNDNLKAIARVYADFTPTAGSGPIVNLPVTLANGSFQFDIAVVPGQTYFIDPAVATGYDYAIGAGNPNFASVVLPPGIGDGLFDIFGFDAGGQTFLLAHDWTAGAVFDFSGGGIGRFRVGGIEASAGLDPASTTAFVTGLTFAAAGTFTGTQTPLVTNIAVAVPELETWALVLAGLGAIVALRRRRF